MNRVIRITSILFRKIHFIYRNIYYRSLFNVHNSTTFLGKINYFHPQYITIGKDCSINEGVFFNVSSPLIIGNNVTISANVFISTVGLDLKVYPIKEHYSEDIVIEDDVWIGAGACILPGITLKRGSVIGAGSIVTKDTKEGCIYVGNPAKQIMVKNEN